MPGADYPPAGGALEEATRDALPVLPHRRRKLESQAHRRRDRQSQVGIREEAGTRQEGSRNTVGKRCSRRARAMRKHILKQCICICSSIARAMPITITFTLSTRDSTSCCSAARRQTAQTRYALRSRTGHAGRVARLGDPRRADRTRARVRAISRFLAGESRQWRREARLAGDVAQLGTEGHRRCKRPTKSRSFSAPPRRPRW